MWTTSSNQSYTYGDDIFKNSKKAVGKNVERVSMN